jgi:hypothetical protein
MIDLLSIQPNAISRNLKGYIVQVYGAPKVGKTTLATKFPKSLLIATEKGYNALAGVKAVDAPSWITIKQIVQELAKDEVKQMYETIVLDTADLAYEFAEDFVCSQEGVTSINKIPFGAGYSKVEKEFDKTLRKIVQLGYGLVLISHAEEKSEKDEQGDEYTMIQPTLSKRGKKVVNRMCDIIGYARQVKDSEGVQKVMLFLRGTDRFLAGSRFKYIKEYIELSYDNLVNALHDAIEEEEKHNKGSVTNEVRTIAIQEIEYKIAEQKLRFMDVVEELLETGKADQSVINKIIQKYLGMDGTVSSAGESQSALVAAVCDELQALLN